MVTHQDLPAITRVHSWGCSLVNTRAQVLSHLSVPPSRYVPALRLRTASGHEAIRAEWERTASCWGMFARWPATPTRSRLCVCRLGPLKFCKPVLLRARAKPCRSGTPDYQGIIDHYSNQLGYTVLILKRGPRHPVRLSYALSNHPTICGVARQSLSNKK